MDEELKGMEPEDIGQNTVEEIAEPMIHTESDAIATPAENLESSTIYEQMCMQMQKLEQENQRKEEALRLYFDAEDPVSAAFANAQGKTPEEVAEEFEEKERIEGLVRENEELKRQTLRISAEAAMKQDLSVIQAIDPTIESLEALGPTFMNLIATGSVDAVEAYYASKAKMQRENKTPPGEIGAVNTAPAEKDFYTKAEAEAMSPEEMSKNFDKVRKSMSKW